MPRIQKYWSNISTDSYIAPALFNNLYIFFEWQFFDYKSECNSNKVTQDYFGRALWAPCFLSAIITSVKLLRSRHLQRQSTVNLLQQAAIQKDRVGVYFPNLYITTVQHSWFTKIEIIKSQLSGFQPPASLSVGV